MTVLVAGRPPVRVRKIGTEGPAPTMLVRGRMAP